MKILFASVALSFALLNTAQAALNLPTPGGTLAHPWGLNSSDLADSQTYQIGSEWGKSPVSTASLARESEAFRRAALATATAGGATTFYLGKFNGHHVMATNHHVFEAAWNCLGNSIRFPLLGVTGKCVTFYGSWTDVDLALYEIRFNTPADEAKVGAVGRNFAFHSETYPDQKLLTIGFGIAANPNHLLMANQDSDCKVFSGRGESRFMGDPDSLNPGDYDAWSFANGCDVSHGDSGSAMVDRQTGEVVGIIWTGKIPKAAKIQDSSYLDSLLRSNDQEIWTELSYAVPATKIGAYLQTVAANPALGADVRETLRALLNP